MVYVVERYLPGLSRSDLLRGLSRLEQATEARAVRYLGSTIVLGDEACFCQFEGPSEAAVAEANRNAGMSFDRIVPAVTVTPSERRPPMTVSPSIPAAVEMRPSRFAGIVVFVAAVAAAITWALVTYVVNTGSDSVQAGTRTPSSSELALDYANALGAPAGVRVVQVDPALDYENALGAPGRTHVVQLRPTSSK
jgi:Nickel responsive protein SCO4226-like